MNTDLFFLYKQKTAYEIQDTDCAYPVSGTVANAVTYQRPQERATAQKRGFVENLYLVTGLELAIVKDTNPTKTPPIIAIGAWRNSPRISSPIDLAAAARALILSRWDLVVRNLYAAGSGFCSAGAHPAGFSAWLM